MPSFTQLVLSAPAGFVKGCRTYNKTLEVNSDANDEIVQTCAVSFQGDHPANESITNYIEEVKVLSYIVYCYGHATPKPTVPEMASTLDSNTFLTRDAITAIIAGIDTVTNANANANASANTKDNNNNSSNNNIDIRKSSNFGRLSNLNWRLGVALSSSNCKNLSSPYVALSFDLIDNNGNKSVHTTEMSYGDFMKFHAEFRKVNQIMTAM